MNARILELIKQPQQMLPEDLEVITKALNSQPYLQSLRALKLMGVHQYQPDLYPTILSETAAYTTDKKILYQLIFGTSKSGNQVKVQEGLEETIKVEEETTEIEDKPSDRLSNETKDTIVEDSNLPISEATEVKETPQDSMGIVLEEEELNVSNFDEVVESYHEDLNELSASEIESNPIEITLEKETKPIEEEQPEIEASYEDTIVVEDASDTEVEEKEEVSEGLSFQQMEAFLPQVKFKIPKEEASATQQETHQPKVTEPQSDLNLEPEGEVVQEESIVNEEVAWQPMRLETRTPDALIGKPKAGVESKVTVQKEEMPKTSDAPKPLVEEPIAEVESTTIEPKVDALPETKVSKEEVSEVEPSGNDGESNVQTFINTWQNWLKVDRSETVVGAEYKNKEEETQEEDNKSQIIEKFIETSPSISKVEKHSPIKEEKEFSVKDKGDDISHLMTETLANLYVEQHLFAKGIEAYEILKEKYPEKASYFAEKIEEVKALKAGKNY